MSAAKAKAKRLRPGELDGLVLSYLGERKDDGPLTATAIGNGIERSAGAVANCLARLAKEKKVRQAKRRPWSITTSRFSSAKSEIPLTTHQIGSSRAVEAASRPTPSISPPTIGSSPAGTPRTSSSRKRLL